MTARAYDKRESILEKGSRCWRIEPDALVQAFPGGRTVRLPWAGITEVRLRFAPTEWKTWRYLFTVRGAGGRIEFDNGHYVSVGEFENRSAAFSAFVGAALDEVAARSPKARLYLGSTPLNYTLLAGPALLAFAGLAWVLWALPVSGGLVAVRLVLLAAMLPVSLLWAVRAWPRRATFETLRQNLPAA